MVFNLIEMTHKLKRCFPYLIPMRKSSTFLVIHMI